MVAQEGQSSSSVVQAAVAAEAAQDAAHAHGVEYEDALGAGRGQGGGGNGGAVPCRLDGRVENWEPPSTADIRSSYRWKDEQKVGGVWQALHALHAGKICNQIKYAGTVMQKSMILSILEQVIPTYCWRVPAVHFRVERVFF